MGVPEEDARHFERGFQQGAVLVTVQAGGDAVRARQALLESGADLGPAQNLSRTPVGAISEDADRLQLREEQLDEDARIESQGDAGVSERSGTASESWRGNERRYSVDATYTGPERRLAAR
jgi:hypothetical protein